MINEYWKRLHTSMYTDNKVVYKVLYKKYIVSVYRLICKTVHQRTVMALWAVYKLWYSCPQSLFSMSFYYKTLLQDLQTIASLEFPFTAYSRCFILHNRCFSNIIHQLYLLFAHNPLQRYSHVVDGLNELFKLL